MKQGEAARVDFPFEQGGTSVAFSNSVFGIQQAKTALQDFQPPERAVYEKKPSARYGNFPNGTVTSSSDVKFELEADNDNRLWVYLKIENLNFWILSAPFHENRKIQNSIWVI